jgi:hypothetical protein
MNRLLYALVIVCLPIHLSAQSPVKKPLTHAVYDGWKKISGEKISNDGNWVAYGVEPQDGDPILVFHNAITHRYDTIARGSNVSFAQNSEYAAFSIKAIATDVKKAKIAKKKGDDLPKDSLGILTLSSMTLTKIPRVKSFAFPEKGAGWLAYQFEKEMTPAGTSKKEKKKDSEDAEDVDKEKKEEKGTTLILRHLASGMEYRFLFVSDFTFSKNGKRILFASTGNDSTVAGGGLQCGNRCNGA